MTAHDIEVEKSPFHSFLKLEPPSTSINGGRNRDESRSRKENANRTENLVRTENADRSEDSLPSFLTGIPSGLFVSISEAPKKVLSPRKEGSGDAGIDAVDSKYAWVKWLVVGGILLYLVTNFPDFKPFPTVTAFLVAKLLSLVGIPALNWGSLLVVPGLSVLEVSAECSGVILMMIFPLTIFLIPSVKLKHRMASLAFIPVIFFGNILRIAVDVLVGLRYSTDALIFFHDTIGQAFIFFWAIGLYLIWLRMFNNFPREKAPIMQKSWQRVPGD